MVELAAARKHITVLEIASETSQKPVVKGPVTKPEIAAAPIKLKDQKIHEPADLEAIDPFLRSWAKAWGRKDVKSYLTHYSKIFQPPGGISLTFWRKQRRQRLLKPAFIEIEIRNVQKKITDTSRVQVTFNQMYRSNTYSDRVFKILDLQWGNKGWKILKETSKNVR